VIVSGDFNSKIGEGAPIGKYGLGTRNENGERLRDFATAHRLIAANATTRQHPRRKYTWRWTPPQPKLCVGTAKMTVSGSQMPNISWLTLTQTTC